MAMIIALAPSVELFREGRQAAEKVGADRFGIEAVHPDDLVPRAIEREVMVVGKDGGRDDTEPEDRAGALS